MASGVYLLSPTPVEGACHLPMIRFELIAQKIDFSGIDGIIFTSKQGVIALDEVSEGAWKSLPAAAIGAQTAAEIEARGGKVIYMASKAYGDVLAKELADRFTKMRWLYPRPKVVVSKIAAQLEAAGVKVKEAVLYETVCVRYDAQKRPPSGSRLVFSAPSIVRCFFENFDWDPSWRAVAIGSKTASAFPKWITPLLSPETSLQKAVEFAASLPSG